MNAKNIILFGLQSIIRVLSTLISYFAYPIVHPFRIPIQKVMNKYVYECDVEKMYKLKEGVKPYQVYLQPAFYGWLFLCGLNTNNFAGEPWWRQEDKEKWFTKFNDDEKKNPIPQTFIQHIRYFFLCWLWAGSRNAAWNFLEWALTEGQTPGGLPSVEIVKDERKVKTEAIYPPHATYISKDGKYVDNTGYKIAFPSLYDGTIAHWRYFWEGTLVMEFKTARGNKRFYSRHSSITQTPTHYITRERIWGWNWWNGMYKLHFKKKKIKRTLEFDKDYNEYVQWVNTINIQNK